MFIRMHYRKLFIWLYYVKTLKIMWYFTPCLLYFEEMEKKQEELKKIKKKKKKEIMDKIAELKQITGNSSLGIQDLDLDQEFDSKQHDEMMKVCYSFFPTINISIFTFAQKVSAILIILLCSKIPIIICFK